MKTKCTNSTKFIFYLELPYTSLDVLLFYVDSTCSQLPAFVPVHELKRKAYQGILGTKTHSMRFDADRITTWVPVRFMHLEGLYELYVAKLVHTYL